MAAFEDCPYKWFLTYLYPDIEKQNLFFSEFGRYVHMVLQKHLTGAVPARDLAAFYLAHFHGHVKAKAPSKQIFNTYFRQGLEYFDTFKSTWRNIIGVETKVNFTFAGRPFVGYIDVVSDDGKLVITDHKSRILKPRSNKKRPTKQDVELDNYFRQLYVYSAAIKQKYGRYPDALEFNCFRAQTIIRAPFSLERFEEVESWAGNQIDRIIRNDDWSANLEYWRCNHLCDVCRECEYKQFI